MKKKIFSSQISRTKKHAETFSSFRGKYRETETRGKQVVTSKQLRIDKGAMSHGQTRRHAIYCWRKREKAILVTRFFNIYENCRDKE